VVLCPSGAKNCLSFVSPTKSPVQWLSETHPPGAKRPEHEIDHTLLMSMLGMSVGDECDLCVPSLRGVLRCNILLSMCTLIESVVYGGNKRCLGFCSGNLLEYGHMKERGGSGRKF
jgi:hypothetical protein